jgi:hypothetical protein
MNMCYISLFYLLLLPLCRSLVLFALLLTFLIILLLGLAFLTLLGLAFLTFIFTCFGGLSLLFLLIFLIFLLLFGLFFVLLPFYEPFVVVAVHSPFIILHLFLKILEVVLRITVYFFEGNRCVLSRIEPGEKWVDKGFKKWPHVKVFPMLPIFDVNKLVLLVSVHTILVALVADVVVCACIASIARPILELPFA